MRPPLYPDRAHAVVEAIKSFQHDKDMPPTVGELKDLLGVGSRRTVQRYLRLAEEAGLIRRWPGARGIHVSEVAGLDVLTKEAVKEMKQYVYETNWLEVSPETWLRQQLKRAWNLGIHSRPGSDIQKPV